MSYFGIPQNANQTAVVQDSLFDLLIEQGRLFFYYDVITLGVNAIQNYLFITPASVVFFEYRVCGIALSTFEVFESTDRNGAIAQTVLNRNRNSLETPKAALYKNLAGGTTDGARIVWAKSGRSGSFPSIHNSERPFVLKPSTKYILRITSLTTGQDFTVGFFWREQ